MKTTTSFIFCLAAGLIAITSISFSQNQVKKNSTLTEDEMAGNVFSSEKNFRALSEIAPIKKFAALKGIPPVAMGCDTLSTTFAGGNGNAGNMFDITAINSIVISAFEGHITGNGYIKIYYKAGTFAGSETTPSAWTLADSAMVTSAGAGVPTYINIPMSISISAGQTYGFYFTGNNTGATVAYTNGTTQGAVYSSNTDLEILEGVGNSYPFGGTFTPRIWNGIVHYCDSGSAPPPIAMFKSNSLVLCVGDSTVFKDVSTFNPTSWNWSFPGGNPSTDTVQNPVVTYTASGVYNVTLVASNANGSDTLTQINYVLVLGNIGLTPVTEDFETAAFPPANFFLIDDGGDGRTWMRDTLASGYSSGTASIAYDNYSANLTGSRDAFRTQKTDLTTMTVPTLYFDVAYSPYDTSAANGWSDTLAIYASTDCGKTLSLLYLKGGTELSADSSLSAALFVPTPSQWRTDSIDLTSLVGQPDVIFSFENRANYGNMMYIDNINIGKKPLPYPIFSASPLVVCAGDTVFFTDNSVNAVSLSWTFQGGTPATSTQQNPVVVYNTPGTYSVSLTATNANGSNTLSQANYILVLNNIGVLPLAEDFEAATFPPSGFYLYDDANDGFNWTRDTFASGFGNGTASMMFNNYSYNVPGTHDAFRTRLVDFSNSSPAPSMTFDVAYSPYDATLSDTLNIYASSDCGNTFTQLYSKGGTTLSADGSVSTAFFIPAANQWRTDSVNLSAFAGLSDVIVAFENRARFGNALYIDNINIGTGTGIAEQENIFEVSISPNPMNRKSLISIKNDQMKNNEGVIIKVYEFTGNLVKTLKPTSSYQGRWTAELKRENLSSGMYFIQISENGKNAGTAKLIIE